MKAPSGDPGIADPVWVGAVLADWYPDHHRRLPWRERPDSYRTWVSEILLQQTRVDTVLARWDAFLARFPDVVTLAAASVDQVLKAWEGLGYYARGRNLHRAAGVIVRVHGGRFPEDPATVLALPGVGRSTAGAILSIAFGRPMPVLDGNVARVLARLDAERESPSLGGASNRLWARATALVQAAPQPGLHNQAMMELGATVCAPRSPRCGACPLASGCRARAAGLVDVLPVRRPRLPLPRHRVASCIVVHEGRILVRQRPLDGMLGGLWEFPSVRLSEGDLPAEAIARHLAEQGVAVRVGAPVGEVRHAYTHFRETVIGLAGELAADGPAPCPAGCRWATRTAMAELAMTRAQRRLADLWWSGRA